MNAEIIAVFAEFGLEEVQSSEISALIDLCEKSGLDPESLGDKWMQWNLNSRAKKMSDVVTGELIARFSRESKLMMKRPKPMPMLMERVKVSRVDVDFASPASSTFADRKDKGRVLLTLGGEIEPTDTDEIIVEIATEKSTFNYMAQNRREIADIFADYISDAAEQLEEYLKIVEPHPIAMPIQEPITVCGMIIMEGQKGADGIFILRDDHEVKLDLDAVESFSLYPGMICALEGNNPTGDTFVVTKIITQSRVPPPVSDRCIEDTTIMIACGPYFTSDSVSDDPLTELTTEVASLAPHIVFLFGPFLDEKHIGVDSITVRQLDTLLAGKLNEMSKVGTKVVLVPSPRDFFADPIMPTPIIDEPEFQKCKEFMVGDPVGAWTNGWHIAGTSNDIILQIMRQEFVKNIQGDKFARIADYLVRSGRFMPLTPPPESVSLDYTQFDRLKLPWTPNLIITPSDMVPFAKEISDTLVVNPGRVTKGKGGGSYAIVQLNSEQHRVKILKI